MNFSRKFDEKAMLLAHSQARIFERSIEQGVPSRIFIKSFMMSTECRYLDQLSLETAGLTETEIFQAVAKKIKTKRGSFLPCPVMHFIGYFYRVAAYITGYSSKQIYKLISVDFLVRNYLVLHTFPIQEAVRESFQILNINENNLYTRFKKIYSFSL